MISDSNETSIHERGQRSRRRGQTVQTTRRQSGHQNDEALELTAKEQRAIYFSRSRQKLWRKGEESGHVQKLHELRLDCDADVIVMMVEQLGGIACHTGRESCFYRVFENNDWVTVDPVLKDPKDIY